MDNKDKLKISIIIPLRNSSEVINELISSINKLKLQPNEVIIIDSSKNILTEEVINNNLKCKSLYLRVKHAYPGHARNIGVSLAKTELIAFLDSQTIPNPEWLDRYLHLIQAYNSDVVFGVTKFNARSSFQGVLRAATYGMIGHVTVPGTLFRKNIFFNSNKFLQNVRMGEDIEWRERLIENGLNIHSPKDSVITYNGLPKSLYFTLKKYMISAFHTARLNILQNVKDIYFSILLILSTIIIPKWNHLIGGWNENPIFIPHVTKIYLISLIILFLIIQVIKHLFFSNMSKTLFSKTLQIILIIFLFMTVMNWNALIAGWVEDTILYMPHITKLYVGVVAISSIIYRGLFHPIKCKVKLSYLFPLKWIQISLLGLLIDLIKAPGYIYGGLIGLIGNIVPFKGLYKIEN